jgi:hypothetical protein
MGAVNLVISCTKRKRLPAPEALLLRHVSGVGRHRAGVWLDRLRAATVPTLPATELYAGGHWACVRSMLGAERLPRPASVWVCSAGYGLVTPASELRPYGAAFTPGEADSVCRAGEDIAEALPVWWDVLSTWAGPRPPQPRRLADVARLHPNDPLVVALSRPYLLAVAADLRAAAGALSSTDLLSVISAGSDALPGLDSHLLPCDARLQARVGGARTSLNVRLAVAALREPEAGDCRLSALRPLFVGWLDGLTRRPAQRRQGMSDGDVTAFIRSALAHSAEVSATALLRRLRGSGRACEQGRFVRLFRACEVTRHARRD